MWTKNHHLRRWLNLPTLHTKKLFDSFKTYSSTSGQVHAQLVSGSLSLIICSFELVQIWGGNADLWSTRRNHRKRTATCEINSIQFINSLSMQRKHWLHYDLPDWNSIHQKENRYVRYEEMNSIWKLHLAYGCVGNHTLPNSIESDISVFSQYAFHFYR